MLDLSRSVGIHTESYFGVYFLSVKIKRESDHEMLLLILSR